MTSVASSNSDVRTQVNDNVLTTNKAVFEDPVTDRFLHDWSRPIRCACCNCFSFLLQLILVASSGSFLFGVNISLLNTSMDHISWELEWCDWRNGAEILNCDKQQNFKALVTTGMFIGAAIGSMTGGVFLSFGRRGMILLSMCVMMFGIVAQTCANSFSALLWARLLCGYAVGLLSVCVPLYMAEVCPSNVRGKYGVFHQLFITVGILVGTLIGMPLAFKTPIPEGSNVGDKDVDVFAKVWWRLMLGMCAVPTLLSAYCFGFVYTFETPTYYVERGSPQDAEQLLRLITGRNDVKDELQKIQEDVQQAKVANEAGMSLGQALKRSDYRFVIFYGCLLSAFQQFSGINVFMASSNDLFKEAGLSGKWPTIMSNIMNVVNCVMTFPAVPLIERLGRRTLLLGGSITMTIGVAPAAICYWALEDGSKITQWLALVGCMVFIIGFACTYGPILWVYLHEIYPTEIKGAASGLATAFNWVAGIIMVFVAQYLNVKTKWLVFMIMCGVGATIIALGMRETKGRTLGDSPYITK